ncbi:MAG: Sir2 silent information regulator family NAD-dependent deacetylase, partial [Clostridia bacterium]|nr:Sir2 silent information regulator family NAD-dependent deacetylase [Clostridia bacterium]
MNAYYQTIETIQDKIKNADAVIIGAGAGLSTAAGYTYSGERFDRYFSDFKEKYGFDNMYYGGFYPYKSFEEFWAFWARYIYINRYMPIPKNTYELLLDAVKDKDYFVLTTNVD